MAPDSVFMPDESPPPYSAVVANPLVETLVSPETALPFSHPDRLAVRILALVSEGKTLDSNFKDVRDVASAGAKFEYQESALILSQRFETLVWESRNIAGIALVAVKDFNEIVLDFLSQPDVVVQDRLKELANASKLLQRERGSAANQKSSFDSLINELGDFHRMIRSESDGLVPKGRRRGRGKGTRTTRTSRKQRPPYVIPRSEPLSGLSTVTASLGAISRTCMDYALQFERIAEQAVFPSCVASSPLESQETSAGSASSNPAEHRLLCPPIERTESAVLPSLVDALVRDLRTFASHIDVFDTVFGELARAQDIFVVYLKDGQSIANQGYRSEIKRLRRHLPCVCNALDAYSKARPS